MNHQAGIWVVDDDQAIRFVLQRALRRSGFDVECFDSMGAVNKALEKGRPQAILTDIRLPDADGLSLVDTLKQQSIKIPIIAMTAYSDLDQAVSAFQKGVFEYLSKPFDLNEVISVVKRAVAPGVKNEKEKEKKTGSPFATFRHECLLPENPLQQGPLKDDRRPPAFS